MKKIVITSDKFNGQCDCLYSSDGILLSIDMTNVSAIPDIKGHLKRAIPVLYDNLTTSFSPGTTIVNADVEVSFEMFWAQYPLHRNKYRAESIWGKMSISDRVEAYVSLAAYKRYLSVNDTYLTAMLADRYLRDKEYKTEWVKLLKK